MSYSRLRSGLGTVAAKERARAQARDRTQDQTNEETTMNAITIETSIEQSAITHARASCARLADRLGRFWVSLFVPSSCPTTAAL